MRMFWIDFLTKTCYDLSAGRLAQSVRAPPLQGGGHRFKSCTAHLPGARPGEEANILSDLSVCCTSGREVHLARFF